MPFDQNPEMIGQAFRQLFLQQRTLQKIQTALLQSPERRHQVAAVHGGNKPGPKRFEGARVVPVEQMAVRPRKLGHRLPESEASVRQIRNSQKSKLAGHLASVQKKTQVGRRHACRDGGGSSCTLSGISQLCFPVLNSAKYRQVRSAVRSETTRPFRKSRCAWPATAGSATSKSTYCSPRAAGWAARQKRRGGG